VTLAFLLLVALVANAALRAGTNFATAALGWEHAMLLKAASEAVSIAGAFVLFAVIYRILPDRRLTRGQWLAATAFTTLLFNIGRVAIGLYLGQSDLSLAFGPVASLAVVMAWVYYAALAFLAGAVLAAASDPEVRALVATATPADPYRLTRQTFRLARLPIPNPIAYPLAWLTTHVYLKPRRHRIADISASRAVERYRGPLLLVHGRLDEVVPVGHLHRLEAAARRSRPEGVRSLVIDDGRHSWLYESPIYRRAVAAFLAEALGGPLLPEDAAAVAESVPATRLPDGELQFAAVAEEPGGLRTLAGIARPGALDP
jgi:fermentation-respiration switch protein FrsA (DUF1100 family)